MVVKIGDLARTGRNYNRMSARLQVVCFVLVAILRALPCLAAENESGKIETAEQEAIFLWIAGDFERAIVAQENLFRLFPNEQRGKAAFFHIANFLENKAAAEAQDEKELRALLERARGYYRKSAEVSGQGEVARARSRDGIKRVESKLTDLDKIGRGEMDFRIASEKLSDFEASRVAFVCLKNQLREGSDLNHELYFLMLVHLNDYMDSMAARLTEGYQKLRGSRPELFETCYQKYSRLLSEGVGDAIPLAESAVASFPRSEHLLEYHLYFGEARKYGALWHIARRDWLAARGDAFPDQELPAIIGDLKKSLDENRTILKLADLQAMSLYPRLWSFEPVIMKYHVLQRHTELARQRIAELQSLLKPYEIAERAVKN